VRPVRKPWWQQATALVTVSTGGVITGFNFVPGAAATMTSPTSVPLHLLALEQAAQPGTPGDLAVGGDSTARVTSDAQLRAAIVNVAGYYLRLAKTRTPAQMEALIWDKVSSDGADHGPSCAAFVSLTLELAAQAVGQQSWVTGGDTYPWPMPEWADVRVDTNPDSPGITSLVADAQAHERWHPLGDGYQPQPGDWAVYDQHVEVVTSYSHGVLDTIGADSLPGLTVNAHSSAAPLVKQGVTGFVDNGNLKPAGAIGSPAAAPGQGASVATGTSQHGDAKAGPSKADTGKVESGKGDSGKTDAREAAPAAHDPAVAAVPGIPASGAVTQFGPSQGTDRTPASPSQQSGHTPESGGTHAGVAVSAAVPGVLAAGDLLGRVSTGHADDSATAATGSNGSGSNSGGSNVASAAATIPGLSPSAAGGTPNTGSQSAAGSGAITIPGAAPAHTAATPAAQPTKQSGTHATHPERVAVCGADGLFRTPVRHARHPRPAGVHQPGRARRDRRAAAVRCAGGGDDRAGDRGVGLGTQRAGGEVPQPVRYQGERPRGQREPADLGVPAWAVGDDRRAVPRVPQ
jgi:hypothetical protein